MAITVSVGRNQSLAYSSTGKPYVMDARQWQSFQDGVLEHVQRWCEVYFSGTGLGQSSEWGAEEAFTVVHSDFPDWAIWGDYTDGLDQLREQYGQDAIAVTVGNTVFI